jgi:S-formylglutathione hydrolase FrmB
MRLFRCSLGLWLLLCLVGRSQAIDRDELCCINSKLHGKVLDFTNNHGSDNRIWSRALCQKRDLYVYVPPGYDPTLSYSFGFYMHGAGQDEDAFVQNIVQRFDEAIATGKLPPLIIAAPDGSLKGRPSLLRSASFWANGIAGRFEDYVQQDLWNFMNCNFRIRPEREAHALIGASMGGTGAFSHGIKYKDRYKMVVGVMPAVNLRWVDADGHYESKFDPNNWGWRSRMKPLEVIGRPDVPFKVRAFELFRPIVGHGANAIARLSSFNPIEQIDRYCLKEGELSMYIGYGGCDEFNIDAQVDSFLYFAKCRGISVTADFDPCGHHTTEFGLKLLPNIMTWIAPQVPPPVKLPE